MAFFIPHDVFQRILNFKDPRYEFVRGGGQTFSAQCMPFDIFRSLEFRRRLESRDPDGNTLMIWNRGAIVHHGIGQSPFDPSHNTWGGCRKIEIYSRNRTIEIVFYTGRTLDEIREERRRGQARRFYEDNFWGGIIGEEYL